MAWTDYSAAPLPGSVVCPADAITGVLSTVVQTDRGCFPMLILRFGDCLRAFVNACPHQYLPLDYRSDRLMSADGTMLMCSAHGARFDAMTGASVDGADCGLDPVPITLSEGMIVIGEP